MCISYDIPKIEIREKKKKSERKVRRKRSLS
jgi:hypothetical protein